MAENSTAGRGRRWAAGTGLVASGLIAGGILTSTLAANAQDDTSTSTTTPSASEPAAPPGGASGGAVDESQSQRPDEQLLTGDTATKVQDAALAEYPGATILRVETDSDGVYEAHLTTADGGRLTVEVGADFAVTGEEAGGPHR